MGNERASLIKKQRVASYGHSFALWMSNFLSENESLERYNLSRRVRERNEHASGNYNMPLFYRGEERVKHPGTFFQENVFILYSSSCSDKSLYIVGEFSRLNFTLTEGTSYIIA